MKKNFGFTLIEIVIVLSVIALLTTFVILTFGKVNEQEALEQNTDLVISVLNEARSLTLSASADSRYGVHFDSNQAVLFRGTVYNAATVTNIPTALNSLVTIQNISLSGGGTDIIFDKLNGKTSQAGSLQIALKNATTTYKTITVSTSGISEIN